MPNHIQDKEKFRNRRLQYEMQSKTLLKEAQETLGQSVLTSEEREHYGNLMRMQVDAEEELALENTNRFQEKVEEESEKSKEKRRKKHNEEYREMAAEYGSGVTMETATMQRNIKRFNKSWEKEESKMTAEKAADIADISGDLFDFTVIKGSKQNIDIQRILRTIAVLEKYEHEDIDALPLSADRKMKLKIGIGTLSQLKAAKDALLSENALDKTTGELDKKKLNQYGKTEVSGNTGISELIRENAMYSHSEETNNAIAAYKEALSAQYRQQEESREALELSGKDGERLRKIIDEKKKFYEKERDKRRTEFEALKEKKAGHITGKADELLQDCYNWHEEEDTYKVEIESKKELEQQLASKKTKRDLAADLRALLIIEEQKEEYKEAHRQSVRLDRMIRGVFEGKPMTADMRMELFKEYEFTEYEETQFTRVSAQGEKDAVSSAKKKMDAARQGKTEDVLAEEMKERSRLEKDADNFQNFLGGRTIESLSQEEKKDYKKYIDFIQNEDKERKLNIRELEKWLGSNAEMAALKGSLDFEKDQISNETEMVSTLKTLGNLILSVTPMVAGIIEMKKSMEEGALEQGKAFSDTVSGGMTLGSLGLSNFTKSTYKVAGKTLETNTGEAARYLGGGADILTGVTGVVTSSIQISKERDRRKNTQDKMSEYEEKIKVDDSELSNLKADLNRMKLMLGAVGKNSSIEIADNAVKIATNIVKTARGVASIALGPLSTVLSMSITGLTVAAENISAKIAANRKFTLRREYVTQHFGEFLEKIKGENLKGEKFANLSDRDIKHTFLKFLGAQSGKRSEAGIRKMAVDSNYLTTNKQGDAEELKQTKAETLEAMNLNKDATRVDVMKAMGATEDQAKNPLRESNNIYKEQLNRSKKFGQYALTRWLRSGMKWILR